MTKRIIHTDANGCTCVTAPALGFENKLDEIVAAVVPEGDEYMEIDTVDIPTDRTFRAALTPDYVAGTVDIDIVQARVIHVDNLRVIRTQKFIDLGFPARLDSELEASIISQATRDTLDGLRDFPADATFISDIAATTTTDELKAVIPTVLI